MAGYSPLHISGNTTGLVQNREEFLLPNDAYPTLQNAYIFRERIKRKPGYELLGRLQRNIGTTDGAGNAVINITPLPIQTGIASFTVGSNVFMDPGTTANPGVQTLITNGPGTATLNRLTGVLTITGSNATTAVEYFPGLPVMGIRIRELQTSANDQTIFFDQNYAYVYNNTTEEFQEFIAGTTWNAHAGTVAASDFFWSTNYWVSASVIPGTATPFFTTDNRKLFWETNNTGQFGANADPPRITDGTTWYPFYDNATPANTPWAQIDATNYLVNWLSMLPFRGRMVTFNTWEGTSAASAQNYSNRIRWSTIGNPFIPYTAGPPAAGSWRDDIRGQGGFLDIPTSEDIVSVGFVRDNLVIYCERSTWQLRYTGRSIAPFQIEKVNSELGGEGPFSAIQFDTSLVGIGDKGIVECDSYKSNRIDIKIPDFVFNFNNATNANNAPFRVHGIRDFINRLAFWTVPLDTQYDVHIPKISQIFPNTRLLYNYENDSWAIFNDSFTTLGNYQPQSGRTWLNTHKPWIECNFPWVDANIAQIPAIVAGNQQGFVEYISTTEDGLFTTNDVSLFISNIDQGAGVHARITSPNHNLTTGFVIEITDILGSYGSTLNDGIYSVEVIDANRFNILIYNDGTKEFSDYVDIGVGTYSGGGLISIRDNFSIISKKFNFVDEGKSIQLGYLDVLMASTESSNPGAISLNVYLDYNDEEPSNTLPLNQITGLAPSAPDTFFNSTIPTSQSSLNAKGGTKFWQRVYCSTRANFLTLEYTFSNAQMAGEEQQLGVQIDSQVLWIRKAGQLTQV